MEIPKAKVLELMKEQGKGDRAGDADKELPEEVDPERDSGMLSKFGIEPADLLGKFGGGKIPGL